MCIINIINNIKGLLMFLIWIKIRIIERLDSKESEYELNLARNRQKRVKIKILFERIANIAVLRIKINLCEGEKEDGSSLRPLWSLGFTNCHNGLVRTELRGEYLGL